MLIYYLSGRPAAGEAPGHPGGVGATHRETPPPEITLNTLNLYI